MKIRFSFTLKILLPYLVMALLFFLILLKESPGPLSAAFFISLGGMACSLFFGILHLIWLIRPLGKVARLVAALGRGKIPEFKASKAKDEIGDLEKSLEGYVSNLNDIAAFSRSMAAGDFSVQYNKLSAEDELGDALNRLKENMMQSKEDAEARWREEENRTWIAQGLAQFSSLFREAEDDLQDLSTRLMKELVDYTEADMGVLFITIEAEVDVECQLQPSASYAFDREKHIQGIFKFGEGLVGRTALEKKLLYITDIPSDYIKIRSGLGEDKPASILLVPVILDQQVLGVMELASLGQLPQYQIEFVSKLADALATTLAKVQANLQNRKLFEQTRKQAEALSSQEKVFKQKLEQLERALEESREKGST